MAKLDPPERVRTYFNESLPPEGLRYPGTAVCLPAARFWTLRTLAGEMRRSPPDLLFVPSHVIPPVHPLSVVTVHDLGYLVEPEGHEPVHRKLLDWTTRWNCRAASGVIAVSGSTKRDLIEYLGVHEGKIRVISHGVPEHFCPAPKADIDRVRHVYSLPDRFVLAVGTLHPRKNVERLIQAFERLAPESPELGLVLCGGQGWHADRILDRARRSPFARRIHQVGFLPEQDMPAIYSAADALAFVSLHEGFGLPLLEAMACGTPVVIADRSALPEISAGAAARVNPFDADAIARGIQSVLSNDQLRATMIAQGFERVARFSWENSAIETLAFLRDVYDDPR